MQFFSSDSTQPRLDNDAYLVPYNQSDAWENLGCVDADSTESSTENQALKQQYRLRRVGRLVELYRADSLPKQVRPNVAQALELSQVDWETAKQLGFAWWTLTFGRKLPDNSGCWAALNSLWRALKRASPDCPKIMFAKLDLCPVTSRPHFHLLFFNVPLHLLRQIGSRWAKALKWDAKAEKACLPVYRERHVNDEEYLATVRSYMLNDKLVKDESDLGHGQGDANTTCSNLDGKAPISGRWEVGDSESEESVGDDGCPTKCSHIPTISSSGKDQRTLTEVSGLQHSDHWKTFRHHDARLPMRVEEWGVEITGPQIDQIRESFFRRAVYSIRRIPGHRVRAWFDRPSGIDAAHVVSRILAIASAHGEGPKLTLPWISEEIIRERRRKPTVRVTVRPIETRSIFIRDVSVAPWTSNVNRARLDRLRLPRVDLAARLIHLVAARAYRKTETTLRPGFDSDILPEASATDQIFGDMGAGSYVLRNSTPEQNRNNKSHGWGSCKSVKGLNSS